MTRNAYDDNEFLWAGGLNALLNGIDEEAVQDGCTPSKGSGDWDVDIASGNVYVAETFASVSSGTVTLTAPGNDADMDSGESRIDLVTSNSSGTLSATEGTAASNPATPDIPSDNVVLAAVHIANSDGTIADSTLFDYRVLDNHVGHIAATDDTFSNITYHKTDDASFDDSASKTIVNITSDSGWCQGGWVDSNTDDGQLEITVDGATKQTFTDPAEGTTGLMAVPMVRFESSFKLVYNSTAGANTNVGIASMVYTKQP